MTSFEKKREAALRIALSPQASGNAAVGCWGRRCASSTRRLVRRASPSLASAHSLTAQWYHRGGCTCPTPWDAGLLLEYAGGIYCPQHTPRASKIKFASIWQPVVRGPPRKIPWTPSSPILCGMSMPRIPAPRLAARRFHRQPQRVAEPPAKAGGRSGGVKKWRCTSSP
jgi:hypothetical protein